MSWRPNVEAPAWLAEDGKHLVTCYTSLLADAGGDQVLIQFFDRERLVKAWKLRELMDPSKLRRTASHCLGGNCWGLDRLGRLEVWLEACRHVYFNLMTGEPVDEQLKDQVFTNSAGEVVQRIPCKAKPRFSRTRP